MLLFVAFFASVIVPKGTYGALRLDALSTLLYVSNWHFILVNSNYFNETAQSSPLLHTWSLAVEEQFYVVWPLVVLGLLRLTRSLNALFALCCAAAIGTAIWMHTVYDGGLNTNRAYLGTDTRSQCLFIGCALAVGLVLLAQRSHEQGRLAKGELWRPAGQVGQVLCGLVGHRGRGGGGHDLGAHDVALVVPLQRRLLPHRPVRRRGHPGGGGRPAQHRAPRPLRRARALRRPDLVRPLHLALADLPLARPRADAASRATSSSRVRVLVTFAVSVVSFHLVERPIRMGTFVSQWRAWLVVPAGVGAVLVAVFAATSGLPAGGGHGAPAHGRDVDGWRHQHDHLVGAGPRARRGRPCRCCSSATRWPLTLG